MLSRSSYYIFSFHCYNVVGYKISQFKYDSYWFVGVLYHNWICVQPPAAGCSLWQGMLQMYESILKMLNIHNKSAGKYMSKDVSTSAQTLL